MSIGSRRDNLKSIMRTELPVSVGKGAIEAIIGLDETNYEINLDNDSRIITLENNETIYQVFSYVGTATSGQVSVYQESSIFDIYGDGLVDAIVVKADANQNPLEEIVVDSSGGQITVTSLIDNLNNTANFTLSGTPTENACVIYFLKIKDEFKANIPEDNIIPPAITVRSNPLTVITVANAGGDFTSIKEALDSITDNSSVNRYVVLVTPGVYTEDAIVGKPYVSLVSVGGIDVTVIKPSGINQDLIVGSNTFYIKGFTLEGVSGATNWAINNTFIGGTLYEDIVFLDCSNGIQHNNSASALTLKNISVQGTIVTAISLLSGNASIQRVTVIGTSTVTTLVSGDGANSIMTLDGVLSFSPNVTTAISFTNGVRVSGNGSSVVGAYDGLVLSGNNTNVRMDVLKIFNCQNNGMRVDNVGTGIELSLFATTISDCVGYNYNILNPNSIISGNGFSQVSNSNVVLGAKFYVYILDTIEGDEGLNLFGELHVGSSMNPAESVLGGGDSHTFEYAYTRTSGLVFTDVTAAAKSFSGSSLTFDGNDVDSCIYIANRYPITFEGIKVNIETAAVLGSGRIIAEYYDGSWVEFNGCTVQSSTPYLKFAKNYFNQTGSYHLKFNPYIRDSWVVNDEPSLGEDFYWIRFRIVDAGINTAPVIQQIKIHTNRAEINGDGTFESHMDARTYKKLVVDAVKPIEGSMQDASIYVDENVGIGLVNNRFTTTGDLLGVSFELPEDCDTSGPLIFVWKGKFATIGDVNFTVRRKIVNPGDSYSNSEPAPSGEVLVLTTGVITISSANTREDLRVDIDISDAIPSRNNGFGDEIWITLQYPTRGAGNFDYTKLSANYLSDFNGRHVRQ